jgi:hypothetical protein
MEHPAVGPRSGRRAADAARRRRHSPHHESFDARTLRRHRGELARRCGHPAPTLPRSRKARGSSGVRSRPSRQTPMCTGARVAPTPRAGWQASTASPTSTAPGPTAGGICSRCRKPASRPRRAGTAETRASAQARPSVRLAAASTFRLPEGPTVLISRTPAPTPVSRRFRA